jgi:hypothetical protein
VACEHPFILGATQNVGSYAAQSRRPVGIAVVGALAISQMITRYITPLIYTYFDELQDWLSRRRLARTVPREGKRKEAPVEGVPVAPGV